MDELERAENDPTIFKADNILKVTMNNYWKTVTSAGKWHFTTESSPILESGSTYGRSTLKLLKSPSKFPFMD